MYLSNVDGNINLQATLSAGSAISDQVIAPHHPITCTSRLALNEDGSLACEHAVTPPDDLRTKYCVDNTIAILLIECAVAMFGPPNIIEKSSFAM